MQWIHSLPDHLSLPPLIAQDLEDFRVSIGCPEDVFGLRVLGSAWATSETQRLTYEKARKENPHADEAALIGIVYATRRITSQLTGNDLSPLPSSCKTFQVLVDFILAEEAKNAAPDPFGWGKRIDSILARA